MRKAIVKIIVIVLCQFSFGQENHSVEQLNKLKNDTHKVNLLNELAWEHKKDYSLAKQYALRAKKISDSISYNSGLSTSLAMLGSIEKTKGNYKIAEKYYQESLILEKKSKNTYGIVRAKIQIAKIHQKTGNYNKALKYSNEALIACSTLKKPKLLASIHNTVASVYLDLDSFAPALKEYLVSIKIREKIKDGKKSLGKSYLDLGTLYNKLEKKEKGLFYLNKSKQIYEKLNDQSYLSKVYTGIGNNFMMYKKLDSALLYYNKSLDIKKKLDLKYKEVIYNNLGIIYEQQKLFSLAEENYSQSISLAVKANNELQLLDSYLNLGGLYRKQKLNYKALEYFEKSNILAHKYCKDSDRLKILMGIAEAYEHIGDFKKASLYNEKHIVLRDSIDEKHRAFEVIEFKYQEEKQNNELLKKEQEIEKEKNSKKDIIQYSIIGGLLLLCISIISVFYAYKSRKAKELAEKNQKLEIQKNIELLKKQELKSIKAMINGQESERKRIAQDLHDRLGSMLSVVKLNYKSIEDNLYKLKKDNRKQYSEANAMLDDACNAVREIAHNMVSGVLTKFGLVAALEDLKNTIEGTNTFQIELITHSLDDRLENNLEMELYGIVQELIHNIIKHAKAKEVSVQLLKRNNGINLTVVDDGIGFDSSKKLQYSGIGLKGIASRVDALKGTFQIDSGKGNGTTINVDIPI